MKSCWYNALIQKTPKTPKHWISYSDKTPWHHWERRSAHRENMQEIEESECLFFPEETMCSWLCYLQESWEKPVGRACQPAERLEHTGSSARTEEPTPFLSQKAQDEQEPVQSFPGSPCSELTPRNQNLPEPRALPGCELTAAQWHVELQARHRNIPAAESQHQGAGSGCEAVRKPQAYHGMTLRDDWWCLLWTSLWLVQISECCCWIYNDNGWSLLEIVSLWL